MLLHLNFNLFSTTILSIFSLKPVQFLSIVGLTKPEFNVLKKAFNPIWETYYEKYTLRGELRRHLVHKDPGNISLKGSDKKLVFHLIYLKNNFLQQAMGVYFKMTQGKVSQWLKLLGPLVRQTLDQLKMCPIRDNEKVKEKIGNSTTSMYLLDASERIIPRSVDYEVQKSNFSGKKKIHTNKNNLLVDENERVIYLSKTYEGSVHDAKICEYEPLTFPKSRECILLQDLGYVGHEAKNAIVFMPEKKPKGRELTQDQKNINQMISSIRVKVEHVIGGVKILRILKEKIRLRTDGIRDLVMEIGCALHNFRISLRRPCNHS